MEFDFFRNRFCWILNITTQHYTLIIMLARTMHFSRMRTARSLPYSGVSVQRVSVQGGLCPGGLCPGGLHPGGLCPGSLCQGKPLDRDPLEGTWNQAARQEITSYRDPYLPPPPLNKMTDTCLWKYYLAQTSFAGVKILLQLEQLVRAHFYVSNCSLWAGPSVIGWILMILNSHVIDFITF